MKPGVRVTKIRHSEEEKRKAVDLAFELGGLTAAARAMGIPLNTVKDWVYESDRWISGERIVRPVKPKAERKPRKERRAGNPYYRKNDEVREAPRVDIPDGVQYVAWLGQDRFDFYRLEDFMLASGAKAAHVEYMLNGRTWNGWNLIKVEG